MRGDTGQEGLEGAAHRAQPAWDADAVRSLRSQLGLTQAELADRIGTRQQTISEWETGVSRPRRMSQRLLRMVAESSTAYEADPSGSSDGSRPSRADED